MGGQVTFDNRPLVRGQALIQLRRRVGMLSQGFHLFPHLSAVENVALPLVRGAGVDEREALRRSIELLDRVGLANRALELPERLSGGQQQRVAIARALALQPLALLFDEPTSALDPESTADVLSVMRELSRDGMTMIVVTHELGFAREVSSELVMMSGGVIVESGEPDRLIHHPNHPRTREFMATFRDALSDANRTRRQAGACPCACADQPQPVQPQQS